MCTVIVLIIVFISCSLHSIIFTIYCSLHVLSLYVYMYMCCIYIQYLSSILSCCWVCTKDFHHLYSCVHGIVTIKWFGFNLVSSLCMSCSVGCWITTANCSWHLRRLWWGHGQASRRKKNQESSDDQETECDSMMLKTFYHLYIWVVTWIIQYGFNNPFLFLLNVLS